jgi:uncharacterized membrane protein
LSTLIKPHSKKIRDKNCLSGKNNWSINTNFPGIIPKNRGGIRVSVIRSFFWGMGAVVLAYVISPQLKKVAKPVLKKGMEEASALAEKGKEAMDEIKTQKGCSKKTQSKVKPGSLEYESIGDTTLEQISLERDLAVNEIRELRRVIDDMQREINLLKDMV